MCKIMIEVPDFFWHSETNMMTTQDFIEALKETDTWLNKELGKLGTKILRQIETEKIEETLIKIKQVRGNLARANDYYGIIYLAISNDSQNPNNERAYQVYDYLCNVTQTVMEYKATFEKALYERKENITHFKKRRIRRENEDTFNKNPLRWGKK